MGQYVLQTGHEGAERLDVVENTFGEASRQFLLSAGLRDGFRVLDVGCGTGALTRWIAQTVGGRGHVVAVDADAKQLELARRAAVEDGLENIDFVQGRFGSDALTFDGFDLVHCRLVLMHVPNPEGVLQAMFRTARQGGIVACEETAASSAFMHPSHPGISRMSQLFCQLGKQRTLDFDVGDQLLPLIRRHADRVVASRFVQPMMPIPLAKRFLTLAAKELKAPVLASGLVTEAELDEMLRSIEAIPGESAGYYAPGRMAQVAGVGP